jgi:hypothetical protein
MNHAYSKPLGISIGLPRCSSSPRFQWLGTPKPTASRLLLIAAVLLFCSFGIASRAGAQTQLVVDCSGSNPGAYPSIGSALAAIGNDVFIFVYPGTCYEDVSISGGRNVFIGPLWDRVALEGQIRIENSSNVFLYGLDVHNYWGGDGVVVDSSGNVMLDTFTSNNNAGAGVLAVNGSFVSLQASGSYSGNGNAGIEAQQGSTIRASGWNGPIVADNNLFGMTLQASDLNIFGNVELSNNKGSQFWGGNGLLMNTGSRALIWAFGENYFAGNQFAGIVVDGHSTLSLIGGEWVGTPYGNHVTGNGSTGIIVQNASQLTLGSEAFISGHSGTGVDVGGNSQVTMSSDNFIQNNGGPGFNIHNNSEAELWQGLITGNDVGVVTSVNSSVTVTATLSPNVRAPIQCDASTYVVTWAPASSLGPANGCKITNGPGASPSHPQKPHYTPPNSKPQKDAEDKFLKLAAKYHK